MTTIRELYYNRKTEARIVANTREMYPLHENNRPLARRYFEQFMNPEFDRLENEYIHLADEDLKTLIRRAAARAVWYPVAETRAQRHCRWYREGRHSGTVYYVTEGMDCDGVKYCDRYEFDSEYHAQVHIEGAYEWADGPMGWERVTKDEYDQVEAYSIDTYAEAMGY